MPDLQWLHRFLGTTTQRFATPNIHGGKRTVWSAAIVCACILGTALLAGVLLKG